MFHPLAALFGTKPTKWEAGDIRFFVQEYLRQRLASDAVYCDDAADGRVVVRLGTPALVQAARLHEHDLAAALARETTFVLRELVVRIRA